MWRRWYCVLNGRLLLFYRSETDYCNLGKFHERLDLGLVYDVLPALGVENGIQISTHTGPHWLVADFLFDYIIVTFELNHFLLKFRELRTKNRFSYG
jgi:hypothetical protein